MALFTSLVLNNGSDHTYVWRGQLPDTKALVGSYIEPAASADAQSMIAVKHDVSSKTVRRSLLQIKILEAGSDGVLHPITINLTAMANPKHTAVQVQNRLKLIKAALNDAGFIANFSNGLIQ